MHAVVSDELHCRRCGYDLRGLIASGRCPECGMSAWVSVVHTVDPATSRLPSLRNPIAVGTSVLILTTCMLASLVLLAWPSVMTMVESLSPRAARLGWTQVPALTWLAASVLGAAGLWGVWTLAPPPGSEPRGAVWIDLWRIAIGWVGWLTFGAAMTYVGWFGVDAARLSLAFHAGMVVFATIGLIGLRGVFRIIGQRSREYRRSQGSRQSMELIIAAAVAGWLAHLGAHLLSLRLISGSFVPTAGTIAMMVQWISTFMVVVGVAYLVMNAWWIRRALRRPPPMMSQVLLPPLPPDVWIPDREE